MAAPSTYQGDWYADRQLDGSCVFWHWNENKTEVVIYPNGNNTIQSAPGYEYGYQASCGGNGAGNDGSNGSGSAASGEKGTNSDALIAGLPGFGFVHGFKIDLSFLGLQNIKWIKDFQDWANDHIPDLPGGTKVWLYVIFAIVILIILSKLKKK